MGDLSVIPKLHDMLPPESVMLLLDNGFLGCDLMCPYLLAAASIGEGVVF